MGPRLGSSPGPRDRADFQQRNRRVAVFLLGWIALLSVASLIVIWTRN